MEGVSCEMAFLPTDGSNAGRMIMLRAEGVDVNAVGMVVDGFCDGGSGELVSVLLRAVLFVSYCWEVGNM
jgi:hypothetical protein